MNPHKATPVSTMHSDADAALKKPKRKGTITQPDKYGFQARIGKRHIGYFSIQQWGSIERAKLAAENRLQIARLLAKPKESQRETASNTGIEGVYASRLFDKRRNAWYWSYQANLGKCKGFGGGNCEEPTADKAFKAFLAARDARYRYLATK